MRAYTFVFVALLWTQGIFCQQSQSDQTLALVETTFTFDVAPPKKNESENGGGGGDFNVTANAVPGFDDFWNDKMIQAVNQVNEVLKYTVPDFQSKINETYSIVTRMRTLNDDRLADAEIVFKEAVKEYKVALEILVNVKNIPTYNNTVDPTKQWIADSLADSRTVLPQVLANSGGLQESAQNDLDFLVKTLTGFTAEKLRRQCFPQVKCATYSLGRLKDLIFRTRENVLKVLNLFIGYSISIDSLLYSKIVFSKTQLSSTAKTQGLAILSQNNVTREEINAYFVRYSLSQNPYCLYVLSQKNKTLNCIYEYDYRNVRCKNMTKNAIAASGYPVVDAFNTVNSLGKNRTRRVLGNETIVTALKVKELGKVLKPQTPDYSENIAKYFEQANKQNATIYERTKYYFDVILATDFMGDLIEWYSYLDVESRGVDTTYLDVASKDLEYLLQNCTATVQTSTLQYNFWLGGTLPARIEEFHLKELEPIGESLYSKAPVSHSEIFYLGMRNLNSTYNFWKPKLEKAISDLKDTYEAIIAKKYETYCIYKDLYDIVAKYVFKAFDQYQANFDAQLIAELNTTAVEQLVKIPSDEFVRLVKDSSFEVNRLYESSLKYNNAAAMIRSELDAVSRAGPLNYNYHRSPLVQHSHNLSTKVYKTKVDFMRVIDQVIFIKKDLESVDASINIYSSTVIGKIQAISEEYANVIKVYAQDVQSGKNFTNPLPSAFPIFARYFRLSHLNQDSENPNARIVDIGIF